MTPRSRSYSGTLQSSTKIDADIKTQTSDDNTSNHEEERPTHTAEIGTLKKLSVPGGTAWLGSSSGVYFVNTVRRAFSAAFQSQAHNGSNESDSEAAVPASEDIITGDDGAGRSFNDTATNTNGNTVTKSGWWLQDQDFHQRIIATVGRPPADQKLALDLVTTFFRQTHPLFPFLHGPKFLEDMSEIYTAMLQVASTSTKSPLPRNRAPYPAIGNKRINSATSINPTASGDAIPGNIQAVDPLKLITFQIIINIAALSHTPTRPLAPNESILPPSSAIRSPNALLTLILPLSTTPLLPTIQLLLSAELYLVITASLRLSSTLAGLTQRLLIHAGLHRCPLRYASLTSHDCEIRKRIFWSAYALDRHLSLALGDPNTFQDSDIDVCLSRNGGEGEMHRAVSRDLLGPDERAHEVDLHYPRDKDGKIVYGREAPGGQTRPLDKDKVMADAPRVHEPNAQSKQLREAALTAYVHYGKLTGRVIEIFHKSINFRFPKEDAIGFLTADIENWWNDLPSTLTGDFNTTSTDVDGTNDIDPGLVHQHRMLTSFFALLYHQLLLLLNRPRLSLDQSTAEFQQGLQVCIRASRSTLSALKKHRENQQSMFLPGLLSAAWMSGLIIAFACQLGKYPKQRACSDVRSCLGILESMNVKWYTVKNCHKVLSLLLANINSRKANRDGYLPAGRNDQPNQSHERAGSVNHAQSQIQATRKRNRDSMSIDNESAEPSPKRDSLSGVSPASSDFRPPPQFRSPELQTGQPFSHNNNSNNPSSTISGIARQDSVLSSTSLDFSASTTHPSAPSTSPFRGLNLNSPPPPTTQTQTQQRAGAALYADPQDIAFAQSNHSMGMALPELSSMDDQLFWGNMDGNAFDIFGAVSWETMTGPVGPTWDMGFGSGSGSGSLNDLGGNGNGRAF